ncbi:MAG: hypothetical protein MUD01_12570 [Chloroflexaceae bacterium]|nr:hypothetical protein [Chloroflexaceae bacterium]
MLHASTLLLMVFALALSAWHAYSFASHSATALVFPYPLDGLEGTLLSESRLLRAGEALYQPLQPDRFISSPYQPISYVALALAETLAYGGGSPPADVTVGPIFQPGRAVSLLGMLGAGLLLALAVWRMGAGLPLALLALGLWLGFPPVQLWGTRIKPDPLALLWTAAGLLAVIHFLRENREPRTENRVGANTRFAQSTNRAWLLVLAAMCFVLAFFTKQTAVAAPAAAGLTLLILGDGTPLRAHRHLPLAARLRLFVRSRWPLGLLTLTYFGLVAVTWLALDVVTGGQYTAHVWGLHQTEWWRASLFLKYLELLLDSWPLLLLGLAAIGGAIITLLRAAKTGAQTPVSGLPSPVLLAACYVLTAVPLLLLSGAKGAHHNHLLEPTLALILAGCAVVRVTSYEFRVSSAQGQSKIQKPVLSLSKDPKSKIFFLVGFGLITMQLWGLLTRPAWYGGEFDFARQERTNFIQLIQSQPGEVLADDVALLLAAGRPLRYDDPSTMGPAVTSGIWDQTNLLNEVANRRFDLILLPFDATRLERDPNGRWTPEFIAALRQHYRLLYRDVIFSYVPK